MLGRKSERGKGHGRNSSCHRNGSRQTGMTYTSRSDSRNEYKKTQRVQFTPHSGRDLNAVTYDVVLDAIVQHVQKEYDEGADIAQSLEELKLLNLSVIVETRIH